MINLYFKPLQKKSYSLKLCLRFVHKGGDFIAKEQSLPADPRKKLGELRLPVRWR